jgi:hypothetical protein
MSSAANRPFTQRVNVLRDRGRRYSDLAVESNDARSSAWFNKLCNATTPWVVGPPDKESIPGLATLLGVTQKQLKEMIAAEWYGVDASEALSPRARTLGPILDNLSNEDFQRIEDLANRLAKSQH